MNAIITVIFILSSEQYLFVACREVISGRVLGVEGGRFSLIWQGFFPPGVRISGGSGGWFSGRADLADITGVDAGRQGGRDA